MNRAVAITFFCGGLLAGPSLHAQPVKETAPDATTEGDCSPIVFDTQGDVGIDVTCPTGLSERQLDVILKNIKTNRDAILEAIKANRGVPTEDFERLAAKLGVTQQALLNFFDILGREGVEAGDLDKTLRQIAQRHRQILIDLGEIESDDPKARALQAEARAAVERGAYDRADGLLEKAQNAFLEALARQRAMRERLEARETETRLDAADILEKRAALAQTQFRYAEAAVLYGQAAGLIPESLALLRAQALNRMGNAYKDAGQYAEAQPALEAALAIRRKALPDGQLNVAESLNNLAQLYQAQGRYGEAEPLFLNALSILRAALPEGDPDIARGLNNLAELYRMQNRDEEAEPLYLEALAIRRAALHKGHRDISTVLNNLGLLYRNMARYQEAEPLYIEALAIRRAALPKGHPLIAQSLNNLAVLYRIQRRFAEAKPLYFEALAMRRASLPEHHPDVAQSLNNLAVLFRIQGQYAEAEPLFLEALSIYRAALPEGHPLIAIGLNNLAQLYRAERQYKQAEALYVEALAIATNALGADHRTSRVIALNLEAVREQIAQAASQP